MKTLGLTGGIGMGKSTAAQLIVDLGVPVLDTDVVARDMVAPGQPALAEIQASFGAGLIGEDGQLDRGALARQVFTDSDARERLEAILHPRIREVWLREVAGWKQEGRQFGVVVIPLLFETNAAGHFDSIICVACSAASQLVRLRARGWTDEEINRRNRAQWLVDRKAGAADFLVWTEGQLAVHLDQLKRIFRILGLPGQSSGLAPAFGVR